MQFLTIYSFFIRVANIHSVFLLKTFEESVEYSFIHLCVEVTRIYVLGRLIDSRFANPSLIPTFLKKCVYL